MHAECPKMHAECPECGDNAYLNDMGHIECSSCQATYVRVREMGGWLPILHDPDTCPCCDGKGYDAGRVCDMCDGIGHHCSVPPTPGGVEEQPPF